MFPVSAVCCPDPSKILRFPRRNIYGPQKDREVSNPGILSPDIALPKARPGNNRGPKYKSLLLEFGPLLHLLSCLKIVFGWHCVVNECVPSSFVISEPAVSHIAFMQSLKVISNFLPSLDIASFIYILSISLNTVSPL